MRWVLRVAVLLLPACFHPNYDHPACGAHGECPSGFTCSAALVCESGSSANPSDASTGNPGDGSGAGDGSSAAGDCWTHWMDGSVAIDASTVTEITELSSTGGELAPWISNDGLRMYFSRDGDIYFASRNSPTGTFGTATVVTNLTGGVRRAWLTSDELTIALETTRDGPRNIYMTTRGAGQPFAMPANTHLAMVNTGGTLRFDPFLTDDLLRLYFSADTGPGGKLELRIATRSTAADDFGAPTLVSGINNNTINQWGPALYQDERLLVFSSFPNGETADLYYATRSSATGSFGAAAKIPTVNTTATETESVLSADGCELYFASDRDTDGHFHLFQARVTR